MHALIKNKFYSNFIIYSNNEEAFAKEILKFKKNKTFFKKINYLKKLSNSKKIQKHSIEFKQPKIGIIGERPEGFDTCDFNSKELKTKFNAKLANFNLEKLFDIASNVEKKTINLTKKKY